MKVLVLEPMKHPYVKEIDGSLSSFQELIGGYLEAVYFSPDQPVVMILNEEGKLRELPMNRSLRDNNGNILDIIHGTAFIAGTDGEELCSMPEELERKYMTQFYWPDVFEYDPIFDGYSVRVATEDEIVRNKNLQ